jgi:hypothetical protein
MIPYKQTVLGDNGNCFSTCIESILELSQCSIPNFGEDMENFHTNFNKWCQEHRISCLKLYFENANELDQRYFDFHGEENNRYCILVGESPRLNDNGSIRYHAVVGKIENDGWIHERHDPHPSNEGLKPTGPRWIYLFWK